MADIVYDYSSSAEVPTGLTLLTLIRTDTGGSVTLPSPSTFTQSGNVFSISFTEPAPGLTYAYTFRRTWADGTTSDGAGVVVGSNLGTLTGVYGDINDIVAEMGPDNTEIAADPDNFKNPDTILLFKQRAISFADGFINARLAMYGFATPATVYLPELRVVFGKLGAYQLYQVRGLGDKETDNKFRGKYAWAANELRRMMQLSMARPGSGFAFVAGAAVNPQSVADRTAAGGGCGMRRYPWYWPCGGWVG